VATVLGASWFATGATSGLFGAASPSQTDTYQSGTVTMNSTGTSGTCTAAALVPNGSATTCTLQVSYSGNLPGWMGLDIFIATSPGGGGENLYNPGASDNPPVFRVSDANAVTYTLPSTALSSCPSGPYITFAKCYQTTSPLLVTTAPFTSSSAPATFTISVTVPTNNGTNYQGATAAVVITAHAVQASNNGTTTSCSAGSGCTGIIRWS
jgi:hypothetical protein